MQTAPSTGPVVSNPQKKKKKLLQNQRIGGKVKSKIFGTAGTNEAGGIKDQKKKRRNEER